MGEMGRGKGRRRGRGRGRRGRRGGGESIQATDPTRRSVAAATPTAVQVSTAKKIAVMARSVDMMTQRRIGLLGGTFDPPHIGHLIVAVEARDQLELDEVWLVVAHTPWQKAGRVISAPERRLAMVRSATEGLDGVVASAIEFEPPGPSYTVETLERLARCRSELAPTLIMGADAAAGIETWHRSEELASLAELAVVDRPGWAVEGVRRRLSVPQLDVSSTGIRRRVADGRPIDVLCPPGVVSLVAGWGLYDGANAS